MKKDFIRVMLLGALTLATSVSFVGCKDYDGDISGLREKVEANTKAISAIEAAMKANKYVVSYSPIAGGGGYELKMSDGTSLIISNGKDGSDGNTVIPEFSISLDNFWQVSTDNGKTFNFIKDAAGNKVKATGANGADGKDATNVTINSDGFIVIGGVVTTLKQDLKVPTMVVDKATGLVIVTLDGVEYRLLTEGSAYNGLQSVSYRKQAADDINDFVEAITLKSGKTVLAQSSAMATFKIWPQTMDVTKAKFGFTDTYKTRAGVPVLTYVPESAKLKDGILSIAINSANMELGFRYASSLDITYNGYTTASDYFNYRNISWSPVDLSFVHQSDSVRVPFTELVNRLAESTVASEYSKYKFVYDKSYNLNDSVAMGNDYEKLFRSMADLGFKGIKAEYTQTEGKAKGIFEVDKNSGVVTVKATDKSSAINEVCFVTVTYKNAEGVAINVYDFAVKAVRQSAPAPAAIEIPLKAKTAADLENLA